jgi:5-methylcytosine-specific restriction endonuclease McrA
MKHIIHMDGVHVSSYANLVLLNKLYSTMENSRWAKERMEFLCNELNIKGSLRCYYCDTDGLKLKSDRKHEQATVDHVIAKSLGGGQFSRNNFVVCCDSCNRRKGTISSEEFINSKYLRDKKAKRT